VGVLELTALPSIGGERWVPWVREADVLLVDGGDATYLCHWMRQSGLADLLATLPETVWVGVSAGSMVMTPRDRSRLRDVAIRDERSHPRDRRLLDLPAPRQP
jgi:peptidase E